MERQGPEFDSEWGPDTGLEEPMWQLGLGEGSAESYPERPGEADCTYYLRTGFCGYGIRCRFNHPLDRSSVIGAMRAAGSEYPERMGQPVCQYYMRTGMCKFGASCKYDHPRQGGGSATPLAINYSGYPLRPGEKECAYFVKTGQCKFGITCKYNHPQPGGGIQVQAPTGGPPPVVTPVPPGVMYPSLQAPYGVGPGNWPLGRAGMVPGSYIQGAYSPMLVPQGMVPISGWNPYQVPLSQIGSPSSQSTVGVGPVYGLTHLSASAPAYTGAYLPVPSMAGPSSSNNNNIQKNEQKFPERPGQADCQYYIKTGDCKFGSSCRYHHPPEWTPPNLSFTLSPLGFPLRPGAPLCAHYAQNGMCKFGQACKFDHPMGTLTYSPSASSLADMPVAPYPVGSSLGTLAPSSSSSDLPGLNKDNIFTKMPSSVSGSVGSIMSKSGPTSQGGNVHTSS